MAVHAGMIGWITEDTIKDCVSKSEAFESLLPGKHWQYLDLLHTLQEYTVSVMR